MQARAPASQNVLLFAAVVLAWGLSWYAIRMQLGPVPPESSVLWRFLLAAALLWAGLGLSGRLRRARPAQHRWLAAMGACLFSCNFLLFYAAETSVPSGVVSVVFSTAAAFNALLAWLLEGRRPSRRVLIGAASGTAGVALLFADQLGQAGAGAALGIAEALGGTLLFSLGNFAVRRATAGGADLPNAMARGMTWGSALLAGVALLRGGPVAPALTPAYLGGLAYLAAVASVLGFLAYLRLAARVGPERAAYATVTAPLVALAVSTGLEGYAWSAWAVLGVPLVVLGNVVVFAPARRALADPGVGTNARGNRYSP